MRIGEHLIATTAAHVDVNSAADHLILQLPVPFRVIRWGFVVTVAFDAATFQAELDHITYDELGAPTRSAGSGGYNLAMDVDKVIGNVLYVEPATEVLVRPGDHVNIQISSGATAGDAYPFIEYQILPFDALGETAFFPDVDTTSTNRMVDAKEAI